MRRGLWLVAAAALGLGGCAYYNSLYNANRAFEQAERAAARGQTGLAQAAYRTSIEKARRSLQRDPDGRWADDASLLIGRAHFERSNLAEARTALQQAVALAGDRETRGTARAYLGAAEVRLGRPEDALPLFEVALQELRDSDHAGFVHLWRARARFALDDREAAWADLDRAAGHGGTLAAEARIEALARAVRLGERGRAEAALEALLSHTDARRWADSIRSLAGAAAERWGAGAARAMIAAAPQAPWPAPARDSVALFSAELAYAAGDTAAAIAEVDALASRASRPVAERARVALARWRLAAAQSVTELSDVRAILLPAVGNAEAVALLRTVKVVGVLVGRAERDGQALALFAAGELTRDRLGARTLAHNLFLAYADVVPDALWAPKALLAAAALAPDAEQHDRIRRRLAARSGSVYLAAVNGTDPGEGYVGAEERLQRSLAALIQGATTDAERRDALVEGAVASLDSVRAAVRADSMRLVCGGVVDSLAVTGALADSVRVACLDGRTARIDTLLARQDSLKEAGRGRAPSTRQGERRTGTQPDTVF